MARQRACFFISILILACVASLHAEIANTDPTTDPTNDPTNEPTTDPTNDPTNDPTEDPTNEPTGDPTNDPTDDPNTNPPPSPIACSYANNTLGKCGCNGQLWIAHQCHSGFFCLVEDGQVVPDTEYQGCEIECAEDEILVVDPHNGGSWGCHKTNENSRPLICPGRFNTECACTEKPTEEEPDICKMGECTCDTQVWVAHDCTEAKICDGEEHIVRCSNASTPYINVNLITHEWFCSDDGDNCLGSFHVGCRKDLMDPDSGAPSLFSSAILLTFLPIFAAKLTSAIMI